MTLESFTLRLRQSRPVRLKERLKKQMRGGQRKPGGLEKHGVCSQTTRVLSLLAEYDP